MKIGLIDVDGHNFPNLALMKLSTYHKKQGDRVEWYMGFDIYDKVYMSKVFTFSADYGDVIMAKEIVRGGTGYHNYDTLPPHIEALQPDYSLYPINEWYDGATAYGFLTRGCVRKCKWCIVPTKEGNKVTTVATIDNIVGNLKKAVLLDNNILASKDCKKHLTDIINLGVRVDFNQGLDARMVTDEIAELLSKIKWLKYIRFAYDTKEQLKPLVSAIMKLNKYGIANNKIFVYCLLQDLSDSYERLIKCKEMGIIPYAQPYRDFTHKQVIPQWQKDMARWSNRKEIFKTTDFKNYEARKGFVCNKYFEK